MNKLQYNWKHVLIAGMLITGSVMTGCQSGSSDYKTIDKEAPSGDATTMDSTQGNPVNESMTSQDNASDKPATTAGNNTRKKGTKGRASINRANMSAEKTSAAVKEADGVYSRADVMPMFPGGEDALQKFIEDNIEYPEAAIEQGAEGDIRVVFTVNESGKVTNVKAAGDNNMEYGLKEEAVAVMNKMPAWTPGKVNGKKVKTRMHLPISFQIVE
jgi:TonB family protein